MMLKYSFISRKMKEFTFVFAILVGRKRYLLGDARRKTITKLLLMFRERELEIAITVIVCQSKGCFNVGIRWISDHVPLEPLSFQLEFDFS